MSEGCSDFIIENRDKLEAELPDPESEYHISDSRNMSEVDDESVELIVTSPPYPGIEMWDELGSRDEILQMVIDVLHESTSKLVDGGIMCVNIGDATRTVDGDFRCYPNHADILSEFQDVLYPLIPIHWKKPTNSPNAFLGGGFKPPNGYVSLDSEHILIFRKGSIRSCDSTLSNASEFTKEQRDTWFTQTWRVNGKKQNGSATFPEEIPYRLIRMFSCIGDTVLDPFCGTGTTLRVANALGRDAIGYDNDEDLESDIEDSISRYVRIGDVLDNFMFHEKRNLEGPELFLNTSKSLLDL